jgi:retinaldehyde-binding protein 1
MTSNHHILEEFRNQIAEFRASLPVEFHDKNFLPDDVIFRALISREFDPDFATKVVKNYMKARKDYPEMFASASDPKLQGIFGQVQTLLSKVKTSAGQHIFYTRALDWDPDRYKLGEVCSAIILTLELKSLDYALQKNGFVQVIDAKDIGWKYVRAFNPKVIHAFGQLVVWYLPVNLKYIIVFNTNWAVDMLWKMIRPLLPKELVERVVMCGKSVDKLSEHIPRDVVEQEAFVPSATERESYAKDITTNDHVIQSLWDQYMGVKVMPSH